MKYIKTFENIFKKHKKLPSEIIKFGKFLSNFISDNIKDYDAFYDIIKYNDNNMPISSIMIDTHDIFTPFRFVSFYYNETTELMMLSFIQKEDFFNIKEYLISILSNEKYKNNLKQNKNNENYFIEKSKIKYLLIDINQDDYELFLLTKKYNL